MPVIQLSLLTDMPDNEIPEPTVKRPSVPLVKLIDGRWCWKAFGRDEYVHEPALAARLRKP